MTEYTSGSITKVNLDTGEISFSDIVQENEVVVGDLIPEDQMEHFPELTADASAESPTSVGKFKISNQIIFEKVVDGWKVVGSAVAQTEDFRTSC